jgi:hypothetical protein
VKKAQLGTYSWSAIYSRENRGTGSAHGGSHYCSWLTSQGLSLASTPVELLSSNIVLEIVVASCFTRLPRFPQLSMMPSLSHFCPNRSPTRGSVIDCGSALDSAGCDTFSSCTRPLGPELLIIHRVLRKSTLSSHHVAFLIFHRLASLVRRQTFAAYLVALFMFMELGPLPGCNVTAHSKLPLVAS